MACPDSPPALGLVRSATTLQEHVYALKQLKNDIIGHESRKIAIIREGIVERLVNILGGVGKSRGKSRVSGHEHVDVADTLHVNGADLSEDDQLRLQTIFVVAS